MHNSEEPKALVIDMTESALRITAKRINAARPGVEPNTALAVIQVLLVMGWRPPPTSSGQGLANTLLDNSGGAA